MNAGSPPRRTAHKVRDRVRAATAEEILAAAESTFAERGFHAARMGDIAERAGLAVGTLYNHFSDKQALIDALVASRRRDLLDGVDAALAESKRRPFEDQLRAVLLAVFGHWERHYPFMSIMVKNEGALTSSDTKQATMRALYDRFTTMAERGIKSKVLKPDAGKLAPALIMGLARGMIAREFYGAGDGQLVKHVDALVAAFVDGTRRRS